MKIEFIISTIMVAVLTLALVRADDVNMEISVNGTANLNISIDTEDSELREDVYGTEENSPAEDLILQYIEDKISGEEGSDGTSTQSDTTLDEMKEFCNDPAFSNYFETLSSVPPEAFIEHMKALGYDDVGQITLIWTMCMEERINENEEEWSIDKEGVSPNGVANLIEGAINWLFGRNRAPFKEEIEIGTSLDSYFASDRDTSYLLRRINDLTFRVEALENTIDNVASEAYCIGKLKVMMDYGLEGVKCNDTTYFNHQFTPTGEDMIIGITPVNGEEENGEEPEIPEEIPTEDNETEADINGTVLMSSQNNHDTNGHTQDDWDKIVQFGSSIQVTKPIEDFIVNTAFFTSFLTVIVVFLNIGLPLMQRYRFCHISSKNSRRVKKTPIKGYLYRKVAPGVQVLGSFMIDKTFNMTSNIISILQSGRGKEEKFNYSFGKGWFKD